MTNQVNNDVRIRWDRVVMVAAILVFLATGCTTQQPVEPVSESSLQPDPGLTPQQVVAIQLEAFASSGGEVEGIEVAFRFASPANQALTGPASRFANMIRSPAYRIMIDYDRVEYAPTVISGADALQRVVLFQGEKTAIFDFYLKRQTSDPFLNCWMTDGVTGLELPQSQPAVPEPDAPSV